MLKNVFFMMFVVFTSIALAIIVKRRCFKNSRVKEDKFWCLCFGSIFFYMIVSVLKIFTRQPDAYLTVFAGISFFIYGILYHKIVLWNKNSRVMRKEKRRFNIIGFFVLIVGMFLGFMFLTKVIGTTGIIYSKICCGLTGAYVFCQLEKVTSKSIKESERKENSFDDY